MPETELSTQMPIKGIEAATALPSHIQRAREYLSPLTAVSIFLALFAIVNAVLGPQGSACLVALATMQALAALMIGVTVLLSRARSQIVVEARQQEEMLRARLQREDEGYKPLFESEASLLTRRTAAERLLKYGRTWQPLLLLFGSLGLAVIVVFACRSARAGAVAAVFIPLGVFNLVAAFLSLLGARWFLAQRPEEFPEARAVGGLLRAAQWVAVPGALGLIAHGLQWSRVDLWVGRALLVLVGVLAIEQAARAVVSFVTAPRSAEAIRAPIALLVAESLFAASNPLLSALEMLESRSGVSVRSSYVLGYIRRAVPGVATGMVLIFWLLTSLVSIQPEEVGVLTRLGRLPANPRLNPGLHLKLPWPIDRVRVVPAERVQTLVIGHESTEALPYILWDKRHVKQEYKLVLDEGRELVSLDAHVYYRIRDPVEYVVNLQNPEAALESYAYRALMREIVETDLDRVLAVERATFPEKLRQALQRELDASETGVEVIRVALRGIHPPVDVARAYQSVVSAQVERITLATRAHAERAEGLPNAEAEKDTEIKAARAFAATRLGDARGEASRFRAVEAAYSASPHEYRERIWRETMERGVADKRLYLMDGQKQAAREYWVDLREGASLP